MTLVLLWDLTLRQHPSLVSFTYSYAPLGISFHLWIIHGHFCCFCFGLIASRLCQFRTVWLSTKARSSSSTRTASTCQSRRKQQSSCSPLTILHASNFLNNFIVFPSNGKSDLSLLPLSTIKVVNTGHPPYLTELLQYHKSARSMRLSDSHLLFVPRYNRSFGACAYRVSAPKIWNSIPLHISQFQSYSFFRRTTFFQPILLPSGPRNAP